MNEYSERYYKVKIDKTVRNSLKEPPYRAERDEGIFGSIEAVREEMIRRYGKVPGGRNKAYRDVFGESKEVGFLHSFWNEDGMYQTDWICVTYVEEHVVTIGELRG